MNNKYFKYTLLTIFIFVIISLILSIWLSILQSFRIIFGAIYLLFIPGFVWSWVFWKKGALDVIERFILSLILSIAIVPLVVFLLNKVGMGINLFNSFLEILGIIILGFIIILFETNKILNILKIKYTSRKKLLK